MLAVYCPTFKRPDKLQAVADNLANNTKGSFRLYWGCEPDDSSSIEAAKATGHKVIVNKYSPGYANTVQTMFEQTRESFFFCANDDFYFTPGWDTEPLKYFKDNPDKMVIGVSDGNPNTDFWTVFFVRRKYIREQSGVVGIPNRVFYPYSHNYTDTEFSQTAIKRGVWAKIDAPCIEHRRFEHDETYAKNSATFGADQIIYQSRIPLFWN